MNDPLELYFRHRGQPGSYAEPGPDCLTDESLASYMDRGLPATDRRRLEDHVLTCAPCHGVLKAMVDLASASREAAPAPFRVAARLVQRGLELLNAAELTVRSLRDGVLQPALGGVRGASAPAELFAVEGPGSGLDEIELQARPSGAVRLEVRSHQPLPLEPGEISSLVLEVDGSDREKRPYTGDPMVFGPLGPGVYRLRLVARAPGQPARALSSATFELAS